jgi:hypothetical protein
MLIKGVISSSLISFLQGIKTVPQSDADAAIQQYAEELESLIYQAIKNADIIIPQGAVVIATSTGPAINPAPIVLKTAIK